MEVLQPHSKPVRSPNLEFNVRQYLGPGEIVLMTLEGIEQKEPPDDKMQICGFLWVYYGYSASSYEGINVEDVRNRYGAKLAQRDSLQKTLREIHPHMAEKFYAAGPGHPGFGRKDETHSGPGIHRRQAIVVL